MIIYIKPCKTTVTHNICSFHKEHPFETFAGCGCTSTYSVREKTDWEIAEDFVMEKHKDAWAELTKL